MKTVLIIVAAGSIGSELSRELNNGGYHVIPVVREHHRTAIAVMFEKQGMTPYFLEDAADRTQIETLANAIGKVDAVIYLVGHCPPMGFSEAIRYPLSELPKETLINEVNMHMVGPFNVFQCLLDNLNRGGCFIFIASAITRLKGNFPPFLHAHHYAAAISAKDWLVEGMRHDLATKKREILVHRIAPEAVDTGFHHRGKIQPQAMLPLKRVVGEIRSALKSATEVDKELLT